MKADRAAKAELFEQYARVGKALSAPKRLELLDLLVQGERSVDALAPVEGRPMTASPTPKACPRARPGP